MNKFSIRTLDITEYIYEKDSKGNTSINSNFTNQIKTMDEISNNLSDKLKGKEQKGFSQKINRTFLGFTIISLMVIAGLFLHTNRNLIMVLDPKYHEYLMDILKKLIHHIFRIQLLFFIKENGTPLIKLQQKF